MKKIYPTPYGDFEIDSERNHKLDNLLSNKIFNQEEVVDLLEKLSSRDSVFLDIGANLGLVSIPVSKIVKTVHSFEPVTENIDALKKNISLNNRENITVHPFALGDKAGKASAEKRNEGSSGTFTLTEGSDFEVKRLDDIADISAANLIKIDVEGMEPAVLAGAQNLIKTSRPTILFEINISELRAHHKCPIASINKSLLGYDFYLPIKQGSELCKIPSLYFISALHEPKSYFLNRAGGVFDVLAIPKGKTISLPTTQNPTTYLLKTFVRKIIGKILLAKKGFTW